MAAADNPPPTRWAPGDRPPGRNPRLALALENLSEMVLVTDLDHRIVYVNPAARSLLGYRPEEMIGEKASVFFRGIAGNPPDLARLMAEDHDPDGVWRGEIRNRKKDGAVIDVHLSLSELRDGENRLLGFVGVSRDITARKEMERQLEIAHAELRRVDREKSDYLSTASHELKTPLTTPTRRRLKTLPAAAASRGGRRKRKPISPKFQNEDRPEIRSLRVAAWRSSPFRNPFRSPRR